MVSILHISDLHIIKGPEWNNMRAALLKEAKEKVGDRPKGEKLLIITGDLHNYSDENYESAENFLRQLVSAMAIDLDTDVFVIPGNHDVGNPSTLSTHLGAEGDWEMKQSAAIDGIKGGKSEFIEWRLQSFIPYCKFVQAIGIYPIDSENRPAKVHVRNWREKLNILHLNTALVSDGTSHTDQMADTDTATGEDVWEFHFKNTVPSLVLGHNNFFDLNQGQQNELTAMFDHKNIRAYLCGDSHKRETDRNKQMIRLKAGLSSVPEIPNIVCMKGAADKDDNYSEFGFYWHDWDEETDLVTLMARYWKRDEDQSEFVPYGNDDYYCMRRENGSTSAPLTTTDMALTNNTSQILSDEKRAVQELYFDYLAKELGIIQFDGIPTDKDSGTVKAELERVFVPLEFRLIAKAGEEKSQPIEICSIGDVMSSGKRIALLAKPGGGKSTLIRRIALAYAYPDRKAKVDDSLPDENCFPIYIRCRDLGENVQKSITEIIFSIVNRTELSQYRTAFESLVDEQLQMGQVILLIDGLDEISNEQYRMQFVDQLYTFANRYPEAQLLITSRESGFRAVAQKLCSYCNQFTITDLDNKRIRKLSENWHNALLDNPRQAKEDSDNVCKVILRDSRITALARNPLLLTTLLFVKRWIGYLPTKKCQLYQEMIKLLLVSWNAAAHLRMDMDETEPQLAFVAYKMTKAGKQTVTKRDLVQYILDARKSLPDLLGYTKVSPSEFIDQVEERSSILIQQGLEEDGRGNLVQSYEFSHLSFQEYLTAKAISENWLPDAEDTEPLATYLWILDHDYDKTQWWEVIPLTAVLLKRHAKPAIEHLLSICQNTRFVDSSESALRKPTMAAFHLANCIACEVPLASQTLEAALLTIAEFSFEIEHVSTGFFVDGTDTSNYTLETDVFKTLCHSEKYGRSLKTVVERELFENEHYQHISALSNVLLKIYLEENEEPDVNTIQKLLCSFERSDQIFGALLMMDWTYHKHFFPKRQKIQIMGSQMNAIFASIQSMLNPKDPPSCFVAAWCIAWAGYNEANIIPPEYASSITEKLLHLWCVVDEPYDLRRTLSWAICSIVQPDLSIEKDSTLIEAISKHITNPKNEFDERAALFLQYLLNEITVDAINEAWKSKSKEWEKSRFLTEISNSSNDDSLSKEQEEAFVCL